MVHGIILSTIIVLVSLLMLLFAYKITTIMTRGFHLDNILFFFMVYYVFFSFIGIVILNVFFVPHGIDYHVYERSDLLIIIWGIISAGLFIIPIFSTILLSNTGSKAIFPSYKYSDEDNSYEKTIMYLLFGVCLLVLFSWQRKIGGIPLLRFISDKSLSQALLRSEATNNFQGHAWRYTLFYETIPFILLILTCFSTYKKFRNILIIYNAFIAVMTFQKGPLINLIIVLFLIYMRKKGKIKISTLIFISVSSLLLIIFMYVVFMNSKGSPFQILYGAMGRIFVGQIIPFSWYFRYVEAYGFLYGRSFPNPHGIFPFTHERLSVNVMKFYKDSCGLVDNGVVGSMPTVFCADWYANFGYIGLILSFVLFSFLLSAVIMFCQRQIKKYHDKYAEALFIYLIFYMSKFVRTSFVGIIFDQELIIPVVLIITLRSLHKGKKYFKYCSA